MKRESVTEKIEHKDVRGILKRDAEEIPPDAERENKLTDWAAALHENALRIAAAGVLAQEGSLEKAASVLWWAGFAVPAGYFQDGHEGEFLDGHDEEALRLWGGGEAVRVERTTETGGFYLAGIGRLLNKLEAEEGAAWNGSVIISQPPSGRAGFSGGAYGGRGIANEQMQRI